MKRKKKGANIDYTTVYLVVLALVALASSWAVTCGMIKLVTMYFGWDFNWLVATAIWGAMCTMTFCLVTSGRGN